MTKEEYKRRMSEIYNKMGELGAERDRLVADRISMITRHLEELGLTYGMCVNVIADGKKMECTFNGVHCNSQRYIYLEFTYPMYVSEIRSGVSANYVSLHPHLLDVNQNIVIKLPFGDLDYHKFMSTYV